MRIGPQGPHHRVRGGAAAHKAFTIVFAGVLRVMTTAAELNLILTPAVEAMAVYFSFLNRRLSFLLAGSFLGFY